MRVEQNIAGCVIAAVALTLSGATRADAAITFDFNSLGSGVSNGNLDNYMEGVIDAPGGPTGNVAVSGGVTNKSYLGDGHVTGPINSFINSNGKTRYRVEPITLGTSDGYFTGQATPDLHAFQTYDTFLMSKDSSDRITMTFDFPVYQISFDYEIFPNGDCPNGTVASCEQTDPNWPDFKFNADGTQYFKTLGILPGQLGTYPSSRVPNAKFNIGNTELAPQFIGTSGLYTFQNGAYKFEFIDWPNRIGIDNVTLCTDSNECLPPPPPPVIPEPSSLLLMGSGLLGALGVNRRRKS